MTDITDDTDLEFCTSDKEVVNILIKSAISHNKEIKEFSAIIDRLSKEFKINVFEYYEFSLECKEFVYLSTHQEWHEFFVKNFEKSKPLIRYINKILNNNNKRSFQNTFESGKATKYNKLRYAFSIWNDFSIFKYNTESIKVYTFATMEKDGINHTSYINNLEKLEGFISVFSEELAKSIKNFKKIPLKAAKLCVIQNYNENHNDTKFLEDLLKQKLKENRGLELHVAQKKFYFTPREIQCLWYRNRIKAYKTIANKLLKKDSNEPVDVRTVQGYFRSINRTIVGHSIDQIMELFRDHYFYKILSSIEKSKDSFEFNVFLNNLFLSSEEIKNEHSEVAKK